MGEAHPQHRAEQDLEPVVRNKDAVLHDIADRHLHPAVVGENPERRKRRSERHHRGRKQVEPWGDARAAKQQDSEEAGLEEEGGERLVGEQNSLDRTGHPCHFAPVRAELERHDDAGNHAEPERDAENLEPEFEDHSVGGAPGREMQRLQHGEPHRQPDREGRKDDVERDGERELQSRQEQRGQVHRIATVSAKGSSGRDR